MNSKKIIIVPLAVILITGLSLMIFFLISNNQPDQKNTGKTRYRYAKPSQSITDFKYDGYIESKRLISITCRHLTIKRKKLGFIRFALIKEAILNDGHIKFYTYTENKDSTADKEAEPIDTAAIKETFELLTSKDSKLLSNFQNISSIIIHPVVIEFYKNQQLSTSISASSGTISLSSQKIIFKKNITIISGKRKLMLDRLELNPEDSLMTGTDYVFYTPDGTSAGKSITTDFNLQKVYE